MNSFFYYFIYNFVYLNKYRLFYRFSSIAIILDIITMKRALTPNNNIYFLIIHFVRALSIARSSKSFSYPYSAFESFRVWPPSDVPWLRIRRLRGRSCRTRRVSRTIFSWNNGRPSTPIRERSASRRISVPVNGLYRTLN